MTPLPYTIRPATATDFPTIRALIAQFPDQLIQDHLPEPEEFFVAEADGTVVACCALEVYSKRLAEVRSLAVSPQWQGHGIATALIDACMREAQEKQVYEVLTITGAPELFEKHGFGAFHREKYALLKVL